MGLLFFDNGTDMEFFITEKFGSNSKNVLTTIAKSLKYSVNRNMNPDQTTILSHIIDDYMGLANN